MAYRVSFKAHGKKVCFMAKSHKKRRTPTRLSKYAAAVKAGKVRRNRRGQITKVLVGRSRRR